MWEVYAVYLCSYLSLERAEGQYGEKSILKNKKTKIFQKLQWDRRRYFKILLDFHILSEKVRPFVSKKIITI